MSCSHPYDNTVETKLQARYDNVPMDQITARICTDCGTIIDIDGHHNVDGTTLTIGLATTGCSHDRIIETDNINIIDLSTDKTILTIETEICTECNHSLEPEEIDLREATS